MAGAPAPKAPTNVFTAGSQKAFNSQLKKAGDATVTMESLDPSILTVDADATQTIAIAAGGAGYQDEQDQKLVQMQDTKFLTHTLMVYPRLN